MRDVKNGLYNGNMTFCPVNCWDENDCPYAREGICHIDDPVKDCDDFAAFFPSWEDWEGADDVDPDAPTDFSREEMWWATQTFGFNTEEAEEDDDDA